MAQHTSIKRATERRTALVDKAFAVGAYPAAMAAAFLSFAALAWLGTPVALASYGAAFLAAALVTLHEIKLPYRTRWRPTRVEVATDSLFIVVVQMALPYLLSITLVVALADYLSATDFDIDGLWPHAWPVAAQAVLLLLAADLPRYWLHRACHRFAFLWRYHAVHHSPHRLYWLNVGRFHPVEKAVQFAVDTLPFALLGVDGEVLGAYFVFYATNGFFQHSNCAVRLGFLNYVVSGPELHRWHHAECAEESDTNFGNNLILWDLVFGTRFLPENREVGRLGLPNRRYPSGFLAQMKAPFVAGLEKHDADRLSAA